MNKARYIPVWSAILLAVSMLRSPQAAEIWLEAGLNAMGDDFPVEVYGQNITNLYGLAFEVVYSSASATVVDSDGDPSNGVTPLLIEGAVLGQGGAVPTLLVGALDQEQPGRVVLGFTRAGQVGGVNVSGKQLLLTLMMTRNQDPLGSMTLDGVYLEDATSHSIQTSILPAYTYRSTGTVVVNVTPTSASWTFTDGDGQIHSGAGNATVGGIPTGNIQLTWGSLTTYYKPTPSPTSSSLARNATVTFTGVYVSRPKPVLAPEPPYTQGTSNQISWSSATGAVEYYVEWSSNSSFVPIAGNSGWIAATSHTAGGLLNGQIYYYRVRARDTEMEESGWSNVVSSRQDASGPTAPGNPIDAGAYTSSTAVRFDWTAATDAGSGVTSYDLQVGTTPGSSNIFTGNVGNILTRTVTGSNGETLYARVRAHDQAGNTGTWSGSSDGIMVDTEAPVSAVTPLAGRLVAPDIPLTWSGQDPTTGSGVRDYTIYASTDGSPFASFLSKTTSTSGTFVGEAGHSYAFYSIASDNAGNVEAPPTTADATVELVTPEIATTPTSFSLQCSEGAVPSSRTLLIWNKTLLGTLNYSIVTTPIWVNCVPTTGSSTGEVTTHTVFVNPTALNAGDYAGTITIAAAEAINTTVSIPVALHVSNVRPTAGIIAITPNPVQPPAGVVNFDGASSDGAGLITARQWRSSLDGLLRTQEDFSKSSNQLTVGAHTITFTAWDDEGTSSSDSRSLTVLDAAPTATIVSMTPNPVETGATVTLTLAGQDNDEQGQRITEGQLTWPDRVHTGILPGIHGFAAPRTGGIYKIQYRVRDDEGTWSAVSTRTLSVRPDPPIMTPEPPYTSGTTNTIFWSAVAGADEYYLQWSKGSSFTPEAGNSGWTSATTYLVTGLLDGQLYYYRVKSRNVAHAESTRWSNVVSSRQDASAPTAPGTPKDVGAYTSSTQVRFTWTAASDPGPTPSDIATYHLSVGTYPGGRNVFDGYVGNVLSRTVTGSNGQRLFAQVCARDRAGNELSWSPSSDGILIDTTNPNKPGVPRDAGAFTSSTAVTFRWTAATDPGTTPSGIASCELEVTSGSVVVFRGNVGNTLTKTVAGKDGQTLRARVGAYDRAGRTSGWSDWSDGITVDTSRPRLTNAVARDYLTLDLTFSEQVTTAALLCSNYSCTNGLRVTGAMQVNATQYRLYTSEQTSGRSYRLTVSSAVKDCAGNSIDLNYCSLSFTGGVRTAVRSWELYR